MVHAVPLKALSERVALTVGPRGLAAAAAAAAAATAAAAAATAASSVVDSRGVKVVASDADLDGIVFPNSEDFSVELIESVKQIPIPEYSLVESVSDPVGPLVGSLRTMLRALYLGAAFTPVVILSPFALFDTTSGFFWSVLLRVLQTTGALTIKLAQWASSRPDLFGDEYCLRFCHLQDRTGPHSLAQTEKQLDVMFGKLWRDYLVLEAEGVLGSGCIGQVHRATLTVGTSQVPVAIKVLHPQVYASLGADLAILRCIARIAQFFVPDTYWLNPVGMANEFERILRPQLDLRQEARNLNRFRRNFKDGRGHVIFPEPLQPFVTSGALVMSLIDGEPILKWAARHEVDDSYDRHTTTVTAPPLSQRRAVIAKGVDAVLDMVFEHNFVHGDLHPGNILVTRDSNQLAFVDAGIVVEYTQGDHEKLIDVLSNFTNYDGYAGAQVMISQTPELEAGVVDREGFCCKIQAMVEEARSNPTFFDHVGEYIMTIFDAARAHHVRLHEGFASIALAIKIVEGVCIQVDPNVRVAPRAIGHVAKRTVERRLGGAYSIEQLAR